MKNRRPRNRRPRVEELEGRVVPSVSFNSQSTNWSGYAVAAAAGSVSSVSGSWNVPAVTGSGYSAQWVGIDGWTSTTVEQIGTEADYLGGSAQYYAWYEMYPANYFTIPVPIKAGDAISAGVTYGSGVFSLTLADTTTGKSDTVTQSAPGVQRSSAEWIVEAPSSYSVLPLANFGSVTFTSAKATVGGKTGPIDNSSWQSGVNAVDMVSSGRSAAVIASTSALTDSGSPTTSKFTVTDVQAPSTPAPPRHHRGGFFGFAPNLLAPPENNIGPMPFNAALAAGLQNANSQVLPSSSLLPTSAVGSGIPTYANAPGGVYLDNTFDGSFPDDGTGNQYELPGVQSGANGPIITPAGQLPPGSSPQVVLVTVSESGMSPTDLQKTTMDWRQASEPCFVDGRWQKVVSDETAEAMIDHAGNRGTTRASAATIVFLFALGGSLGIAPDEATECKRWDLDC